MVLVKQSVHFITMNMLLENRSLLQTVNLLIPIKAIDFSSFSVTLSVSSDA